jgi:hypothetical protein
LNANSFSVSKDHLQLLCIRGELSRLGFLLIT